MELRTTPTSSTVTSPPRGLRLAGALLLALLLLLAPLAGRAKAGAADFPSPLYLSGTTSSSITGSFKLIGTAGPGAAAAAPTASVVAGGSVPVSNYTYVHTYVGADGETAPSPISNSVNTTAGN